MKLIKVLSKALNLPKVHKVRSEEELEAIAKFRYNIYIQECGRAIFANNIDHENKIILDNQDHRKNVTNYYVGSLDDIKATFRLRVWPAGKTPPKVMRRYNLSQVHDIENISIAEFERYLVSENMRGTKALITLMLEVWQDLYLRTDCELVCCFAPIGLVSFYEKHGLRIIPNNSYETEDGIEYTMLGILYDLDYVKKRNQIVYRIIKNIADPKKAKHRPEAFTEILTQHKPQIITKPKAIKEILYERLFKKKIESPVIVKGLPKSAQKIFFENSIIINVPAHALIIKQGYRERELFIIISGKMNVMNNDDDILAELEAGEIFGELALLSEEGKHLASVYSKTPAQLLVIRHKVLKAYMQKFPDAAISIQSALTKIIISRFSALLKTR